MSYHTLSTKNSLNAGIKSWLKRGTHLGLGIGAFTPILALANPTGGQVVAGHATITSPSANGTVVKQSTQSAIINWQQFNIGQGQYVQFLQPSSSSVVLNRVIGGGATSILGNLHGNGQVFLVNTNGVYFGKASTIDAQGFLASTLDISDSDFLSHDYEFDKAGSNTTSDTAKTVVNDGSIIAHPGGYVVLAGDYTQNDGLISAQSGHIILASGAKSTLTLSGNGLVSYVVNQATLASLAGADNAGKLEADGGAVVMTADVANLLKATVVNNTGLIEAHAISKAGGTIQLLASGGNIVNAGSLDADANRSGLTGGTITLKGDAKTTLTDTSKISATGLGADGGNLEISGNTISVRGTATLGHGGNMLLDPGVMEITLGSANSSKNSPGVASNTASHGNIGVNFIQNQLNKDVAVTIQATHMISASANVKTITAATTAAKGGGGKLTLTVDTAAVNGNVIELPGVDINITGDFQASAGYGAVFGHVTANSIDVFSNRPVTFAEDVVNSKGAITKFSAKSTGGGITINAPEVFGSNEAGLALSATGGGIDITGNIHANGNLTLQGAEVEVDGSVSANGAFKAVASNGYAHFGEVSAQNGINISATTTNASSDIVVSGAIQAYGGNVVLNDVGGGIVTKSISGNNITLTATGNDIRTGRIDGNGSVTVNAGTHNFSVSSGGYGAVVATKGTTLTANQIHYTGTGSFGIAGGSYGGVTVKGVFGDSAEGFSHALDLRAGKNISVDHSIKTHGYLDIFGAGLAFTGKTGDFTLSATGGNLDLHAPIGTAAAPVKYTVHLDDTSGAIFVGRSIFTADSIVAIQGHHGSDTLQGVLVGSGDSAVTLSATKDISLTGANIGIGAVRGSADQVSLIAGGNVSFAARGSSSHHGIGNVGIQAGGFEVNTGTINTSILVQAGGNITISGNRIDIHAGEIGADINSGATRAVTGSANVTLKAGGNLDLTASNSNNRVNIDGGSLFGTIAAAAHKTYTGNFNANVSLTAGKAMAISGSFVDISHGYGGVAVQAHGVSAVAKLTQNANVSLKAGTTLTLTGNGGSGEAGVYINQTHILADQRHVQVQASSHGKASVVEHADVSFTAGTSIDVSGHQVRVSAGYGLASQSPGSGNHGVFGTGAGATATYTATADLNFKAGTGGITLSGLGSAEAGVSVRAGEGVAKRLVVIGDSGGKASASLHANVNMVTTGTVLLQGASDVFVGGANSAAHGVVAIASNKGGAKLTAGGNVSISAKNFTMSSGEGNNAGMGIEGGQNLGAQTGPVGAHSGGSVSITDSARVDIKVTGAIIVTDKNEVDISGGNFAGGSGSFLADAGKATVSNDAGVSLTAGGNINLTGGHAGSPSQTVNVEGGGSPGNEHGYTASYGGTLTDTTLSQVDITAGGSFTANAATVHLFGGSHAGGSRDVGALSNGKGATKTTVVSDNSLNITAGSITLTGKRVIVDAGHNAGASVTEVADGAKAVTNLTVNSGVNLTAAKAFDISAGTYIDLFSGPDAGHFVDVTGSGGKAADTINAGLIIKAGSVLLHNSAGGRQSISGGGHVGSSAGIHASGGGSANVTVNAGLSVITTGTFVVSGADRTLIVADSAAGRNASLDNDGGLKVTDTLNNSVTISAKSLTISAANSVEFFAGSSDLTNTRVTANGGAATMNVNSSLSLTAAQGITVNITGGANSSTHGTHGTNRRIVLAGGFGAQDIDVDATHGGKAAIGLADGITVKAGGAISLKNLSVGATSTTLSGTASSIVNHPVAAHGIFVVAGTRIGGGYVTGTGSHTVNHDTEVQTGVGGGTATLTADAGVTIATKGAFTADAGTGSLLAAGGSAAASHATVRAGVSGKASATVTEDLNITALSAAFSGGSVVLAGGGVVDGAETHVLASHGGIATLDAESALRITTTKALTVTGTEVSVTSGKGSSNVGAGFLAQSASVNASHSAQAALVATSTVQLHAGSVSMTATDGFVHIFTGAVDGPDASVTAHGKGDKASATLNGTVNITATTGGITLKAEGTPNTASSHLGAIGISAGSYGGIGERVTAGGAGAAATLTLDTSVNLSAKTKVTATASGSMHIDAGSALGAGDLLLANGKGAKTLVTQTASVNITGSAASFKAMGGSLVVQGAGSEGVHTIVGGTHSGSATVKETGTVNIKTTVGALTLDASHGSLDVRGGHGAFSSGTTKVSGSHHGVATLTALAGVSLQAAGAVSMNAGNSISLSAGFGYVANVNAQEGGTATLTRDSSLAIKAGTTLNVGAGSDIFILGGQVNRIMSNTFLSASSSNSRAGGKAAATLTAGVNMAAGGDVTIGAGSNLVIEAGAGNQLFVGTARIHGGASGQAWNGGTATLSANTSVTVTAGRDLHLIAGGAGTGSLQVLGMANGGGSFNDQANVRGGSSSAVAKLTLIGNATLTAARDITIAAAGNASIVGGSLGNLRDDHAVGKVTILGSADATLKAGRDVTLSGITGSLTVAGVNVNSSHAGGILADVHASGGSGSVTAHGDANIIAGRNITTGSHSLAGLNVVGGEFVDAANLGYAANEHATATANAGLTAGGAITIKGTGDLNVLGGLFDSAAITNTFSNGISASGNRTATQSARATITATGAVTLTLKGDGVIAGGDSLAAKASLSDDRFMTATATANTGVLIKGSSVSITVGGNLLTRAGSATKAKAEGIGSDLKATATASADASITATGNVVIADNGSGGASFIGGSAGKGSAITLFSNNAATATAHADLNIAAGKALTITAGGDINVSGGPGDENSALVVAGVPTGIFGSHAIGGNSDTATATVSSKVSFTAGTALTVTAGGAINVFGGSRGADSAVVSAIGGPSDGHKDHATLTLDQSVNMKGATVTLTADGGAGSVNVTTFVPSSGAPAPALVSASGAGNTAKASVNDSVTITSKTAVTIAGTFDPNINRGSGTGSGTGTYTSSGGNLVITGTIKVTGQATVGGFHPSVVRPQMVRFGTESLRLAPDTGTTSFGRIQSLGGASLTPAATQPEVIIDGGIDLPAPAVTTLDTLQVQSVVPSLVTVTISGDDSQQSKPASRTDEGVTFQPDLAAADFTGSFPSSCSVLVVSQADHRCPVGGK